MPIQDIIKNTLLKTVTALVLLALSLASLGSAYSQGRLPSKVVVAPVVSGEVQEKSVLIGTVEPWKASTVAAEVSGKVESLAVRRGVTVKEGEILARLGKSELLFKLKEVRAQKNATKVRLEKAEDLLERAEKLMKGQGIPEREYRQTRLTVRELEEDLISSQSEIFGLEDELGKKTVRAPFSGIVTEELTEQGQWVSQGGGVVHMIDLSRVRIVVDLPEKYVSGVKRNAAVTVKIDALGAREFKGKIHALIPLGDKDVHLFPLEIHVENEDLMIKGGMFARVEFDLGLTRNSMLVPKDSVITRGAKTYLFTVSGGKAKQVYITTGQPQEDFIEISGPLEEGELVIIRGNERVRNGQPVEVIPAPG